MNDSHDLLEERLRRLPGVVAARIQTDASGIPISVQVHVSESSDRERLRDQVVALFIESGIAWSPAQIHWTSIPDHVGAELEELEVEGRMRLIAYQVRVDDAVSQAEVELGFGTDHARGVARVRGGAPAPDLVAQACLDAIERLCYGRVTLRLAATQRLSMPTGEVVCVAVQEISGRTSRLHTGIAAAGDDPARAVAYAVLAACNRPFGRILAGPPRHFDIS
jgi:hypothetical protein